MSSIIIQLQNYKGCVNFKWELPKTKRQIGAAVKKLSRLFFRIINANLLYPKLLEAIKILALHFEKLLLAVDIKHKQDYLTILSQIKNYQTELEFKYIAEKRVKTLSNCSICSVRLVYPAYVVMQKSVNGSIETFTSAPIGIFCLHRLVGKLEKLIKIVLEINNQKEKDEEISLFGNDLIAIEA